MSNPASSDTAGFELLKNSHRVVLLTPPDAPLFRALALELAGHGHSLILWLDRAATPNPGVRATLELQLEIEQAGGISLVHPWADLAAEAFGRIDVALAADPAAAQKIIEAAERLDRRLRPARLLILEPGPSLRKIAPASAADLERLKLTPSQAALGIRIHTLGVPQRMLAEKRFTEIIEWIMNFIK